MKMLLDTHVLLWYVMGDARLCQRARDIIDRILVAQVIARSAVLVSGDTKFDRYALQRVWE